MREQLREQAAAGFLLLLAIGLMWAGFAGRAGLIAGAIICPQQLQLVEQSGTGA